MALNGLVLQNSTQRDPRPAGLVLPSLSRPHLLNCLKLVFEKFLQKKSCLHNVNIDFSSSSFACLRSYSLTLIVSPPFKFNISFYLNNVSYQIEFETRVQLHRTLQISPCSIVSQFRQSPSLQLYKRMTWSVFVFEKLF